MRRNAYIATIAALAALGLTACGDESSQSGSGADLPRGSEPVKLDPADFTLDIDNPYLPVRPGSRWVYRETDTTGTKKKVVVTVLPRTKTIANGIKARVVRDKVTENGKAVEITDDWFAQDGAGNVWYFGEAVRFYENGRLVSRKGSFEAGVDGAQAGVVMPAAPRPGMRFRQEYYEAKAEANAKIVAIGEDRVEVPAGFYDSNVLMTRDLVPTEPKVEELKFYARGVGPVLSVHTDGEGGRTELVSFEPGRG